MREGYLTASMASLDLLVPWKTKKISASCLGRKSTRTKSSLRYSPTMMRIKKTNSQTNAPTIIFCRTTTRASSRWSRGSLHITGWLHIMHKDGLNYPNTTTLFSREKAELSFGFWSMSSASTAGLEQFTNLSSHTFAKKLFFAYLNWIILGYLTETSSQRTLSSKEGRQPWH